MSRFSKMHPCFHFVYFVCVFVLAVCIYNPIFAGVSLVCGLTYDFKLRGKESFSSLKFSLAILCIVSIFNMLFAHYGNDVLFIIGSTKFTLEALFYGFNQGLMVASMIMWFSIFGRVVDSEKVIYLLRFSPKIALIFSMVLGFIPRFSKKLKEINQAQLGLNGGKKPKKLKDRLNQGISNLSALITYSLESSIVTADSMNARGYNPKSVNHKQYKIKALDIVMLFTSLAGAIYILFSKFTDRITFVFDPVIYFKSFDVVAVIVYCILGLLPMIIDLVEEMIWKLSAVRA